MNGQVGYYESQAAVNKSINLLKFDLNICISVASLIVLLTFVLGILSQMHP